MQARYNLSNASGQVNPSWDVQDWIVFSDFVSSGGINRISAAGGEPQTLAIPDAQEGVSFYSHPSFLPNEKAVLFTSNGNTFQIVVLSLETGERKILIQGGRGARYAPTGHLLYEAVGTATLMAVPFDLETLNVTGSPTPVLENIRLYPWRGATLDFSFSNEGTLVYVPAGRAVERSLVWVDREGNESPITNETRSYSAPRISPDGRQLSFGSFENNVRNLWIYDLEGESFRRLTFAGNNGSSTWSPDGQWIVFQSTRDGTPNLYRRPADGSGSAERLTTGQFSHMTLSWSSDGSAITCLCGGRGTWVLPMEGNMEPRLLIPGGSWGVFSPDVQWVAYAAVEGGRSQIHVARYQDPDVQWMVSGEEGGAEPVWSPDGKELFYRSADRMMVVSIETEGQTLNAGKPRVLFEGRYSSSTISVGYQYYDVAPDGERFLMMKDASQDTHINIVQNWFEELKRLVPTP